MASESESEGERMGVGVKKKRGRRVSFADTEITSVHIFRRDDEDYDTPKSAADEDEDEMVGFFRDLGGGDTDDDECFLRAMGSPCQAAADDGEADENFFGPVSSSFIRPSGACESEEETLDSSAFSLHYRSLARSESGMALTDPKKKKLTPESCSEDNHMMMSMVSMSGRSYHYATLSPPPTKLTLLPHSPMHWLTIFHNFSWDAHHFLPPSTNLLTFEALGKLEDIINYFLKAKHYEMLHSEIHLQKPADQFSVMDKKRMIAETRVLLCRIAHEKAKLHLRSEMHQILQKKVQLLKSRFQECQMLKLNFIQHSKFGRRGAHLGHSQFQSCPVNLDDELWVASDSVNKIKDEINSVDQKINVLSNLFKKYCKMNGKGELSSGETLASIQDHLLRRKCYRLIRQDLQLWKIDGFENQNGQFNIHLNYQGYLSQRFTLTSEASSSIIISNQLNEINILKAFPNMEAHVAFAFVYNAEITKRVADSKCLGQETRVTEFRMCNLVDVMKEVQMAGIEIGNLVGTKFDCAGPQLDLQLSFIGFESGVRVTLSLDVTCLNSGMYPSAIVPYKYEVQARTETLLDDIKFAAQNLEVGYLRITKLCRAVSQRLLAYS